MLKERQISIYNGRADFYDRRDKKRLWAAKHREQLFSEAGGRILEVAVGTGSNFRFYPKDAEIIAVDFSPAMIEMARKNAAEYQLNVQCLISDVESLEFDADSFDTIVSTLSLCAYLEPIKVLKNFGSWCKADGRILLLEHGKNGNLFFDWFLNRLDNWHLRSRGCHCNRDIGRILEEAKLKVEKVQKINLFYYLIWARPGE